VRVDGIQVGKVDDVLLSSSVQPDRVVKVTMIVDRDLLSSITIDSTAQPAADTLVGDKFIQISSGKSRQRVQPGAEIAYKGSADLMTSVDLTQFRKSIDQMDAILTDIENARNPLGQFIMSDDMYRDLLRQVGKLEGGLHAATRATSAVGHEIYTDALYVRIVDPIARLDSTLARLQSGQGRAGQFLRDNAQYDQFQSQLETLHKSIADVRRSEFLVSVASYDEWSKSLTGLVRKVDEFSLSPMISRQDAYENISGAAKELQEAVKDFRQDPRKFLRLGLF